MRCIGALRMCLRPSARIAWRMAIPEMLIKVEMLQVAALALLSHHRVFERSRYAGFTLQDLEDAMADKTRWQEAAQKSALLIGTTVAHSLRLHDMLHTHMP